ncbi:MAG: tetratricopeptide repeat protein [bacterium]
MEMQNFEQDVIAASSHQPVVVDFWAPWCQPCLVLGPVLEKLEKQAAGKWRLVKVNTDADPELAQAWGIRGIPAVKMFHQGQKIAEFTGALPETQVLRWLETHLPSAAKMKLQAAKEALARGDRQSARKLLQEAVADDPQNPEARVLWAEQILLENPEQALALLEGIDEANPLYYRVQALQTLHRLLQLKNAQPSAHTKGWEQYWQGIAALRRGDFAAAFEAWIEAMLYDRQLDDDGARRACVALFTFLGNEDPIAQGYRRKFSSALY